LNGEAQGARGSDLPASSRYAPFVPTPSPPFHDKEHGTRDMGQVTGDKR